MTVKGRSDFRFPVVQGLFQWYPINISSKVAYPTFIYYTGILKKIRGSQQ